MASMFDGTDVAEDVNYCAGAFLKMAWAEEAGFVKP